MADETMAMTITGMDGVGFADGTVDWEQCAKECWRRLKEAESEIERLRKEVGRRDVALGECHKEIFKLRDAMLSSVPANEEQG